MSINNNNNDLTALLRMLRCKNSNNDGDDDDDDNNVVPLDKKIKRLSAFLSSVGLHCREEEGTTCLSNQNRTSLIINLTLEDGVALVDFFFDNFATLPLPIVQMLLDALLVKRSSVDDKEVVVRRVIRERMVSLFRSQVPFIITSTLSSRRTQPVGIAALLKLKVLLLCPVLREGDGDAMAAVKRSFAQAAVETALNIDGIMDNNASALAIITCDILKDAPEYVTREALPAVLDRLVGLLLSSPSSSEGGGGVDPRRCTSASEAFSKVLDHAVAVYRYDLTSVGRPSLEKLFRAMISADVNWSTVGGASGNEPPSFMSFSFLIPAHVPLPLLSQAACLVTAPMSENNLPDSVVLLFMNRMMLVWPPTAQTAKWVLMLLRALSVSRMRLLEMILANASRVLSMYIHRALVHGDRPAVLKRLRHYCAVLEVLCAGYQCGSEVAVAVAPKLHAALSVLVSRHASKLIPEQHFITRCRAVARVVMVLGLAYQLLEPEHKDVTCVADIISAIRLVPQLVKEEIDKCLSMQEVASSALIKEKVAGGVSNAAHNVFISNSNNSIPSAMPVCRKLAAHYTGLRNVGNTCFMASVVQCLYANTALKLYCLRIGLDLVRANDAPRTMMEHVSLLFLHMYSTSCASIAPTTLHRSLPPPFNSPTQQDAAEFLHVLFDALYCSYVTELYKIKMRVTVVCSECKGETLREEEELVHDVALEVESNNTSSSLQTLLDRGFATELLDGENQYRCDRCNALRDARCLRTVVTAPPHLIIALKRFTYSRALQNRVKVLTPVTLPAMITLPSTDATYRLRAAVTVARAPTVGIMLLPLPLYPTAGSSSTMNMSPKPAVWRRRSIYTQHRTLCTTSATTIPTLLLLMMGPIRRVWASRSVCVAPTT